MKYFFVTSIAIILLNKPVLAQQTVQRKDLLNIWVDQHVSSVEAKQITMSVNAKAPRHMHPCPVAGYIISGKVLYQSEGNEAIILNSGDAFFEPKNKTILHFDNISENKPLVFIVFYMKEDKEPNIQILEK